MSDQTPYGKLPQGLDLPRNPVTHRIHRREVLRQIILPIAAVLLVAGAGVYLVIYYQIGSLEKWAEMASILLIGFIFVVLLIPLVLLVALIYVASQMLRQLPPAARRAQSAIEKVQRQIRSGADITVQPLIQIQSFVAMVESLFGRRR